MSTDIAQIGSQKVKSIASGETLELKSFWEDQNVVIIFFRRWGCMLCRLWAKELSEITPVLNKHNMKMIGIGLEEAGSKDFINGKYFDGELYYVDNISTYQALGFKRFNVVTLMTSLLWKQSRDALFKGVGMGLRGDWEGDRVQTGGAVLVAKGGKLLRHFVQTGPGDHLSNKEILQHFGLGNEYNPEPMANKKPEEKENEYNPEPMANKKPEEKENEYNPEPMASKKPEEKENEYNPKPMANKKPEEKENEHNPEPMANKKPEEKENEYNPKPMANKKPEEKENEHNPEPMANKKPEEKENEHNPEPMASKKPEEKECTVGEGWHEGDIFDFEVIVSD